MKKPGSTTKRGFTLIELLVVIAIIAILAAILFPVFAKAREQAWKSRCLNNEKQIGVAFEAYASDYDGILPPGNVPAGDRQWDGPLVLFPYVRNEELYKCPTDSPPPAGQFRVSYGFNDRWNTVPGKLGKGMNKDKCTSPGDTVLLGEAPGGVYPAGTIQNNPAGGRHDANSGSNYLFFDMHARYYKANAVVNDPNATAGKPNYYWYPR